MEIPSLKLAKEAEIRAIAFYPATVNTSYEIYIYKDVTPGNPTSGTLSATKSGTLSTPGYHTVILSSPVPLYSGQRFSVVVKFTTPGYNYPVPTEDYVPGYSSNATSNPGESFISSNGVSWYDISADSNYKSNICIKAFTGEIMPQYIISGYVRTPQSIGVSGVSMNGLPSTPLTGRDWFYSDSVLSGWSGTVTPPKTGYTFSPSSRIYTNVISNQAERNYTAS